MPREKESYRDNLELILASFPGKSMLNKKEVATFCGLDYATVNKLFEFTHNYISVAKLARQMS
ncbi:hypothetical protein [Hydrogenoanaerobacterium sp.]|uniref:hypothetical protein n=1 Tax=Hydrogenoanaerobacterium sp. TaxID=2953763 RepID=UPI0028A0C721|nr:hypothetical protein [Hydrogenoanaerobacterium sp.]